MRKLFILTVGLCFSLKLNAQVTWADQAAQVFYDRCTECHNTEGIGPMSLIEYAEAQTYLWDPPHLANAFKKNLLEKKCGKTGE